MVRPARRQPPEREKAAAFRRAERGPLEIPKTQHETARAASAVLALPCLQALLAERLFTPLGQECSLQDIEDFIADLVTKCSITSTPLSPDCLDAVVMPDVRAELRALTPRAAPTPSVPPHSSDRPRHELRDLLGRGLYDDRTNWPTSRTNIRPGRPSTPTSPADRRRGSSSSTGSFGA